MRSSSVRFSIIVASACTGLALSAGGTRSSHAATYFLPAGFASAYYWPTAYYPAASYAAPTVLSPTAYYAETAYSYPSVFSGWSWPAASPVLTSYAVDYTGSAYYSPTAYTRSYTTGAYIPTYYDYPVIRGTSYVTVPGPPCAGIVAAAPVRIVEPSSGPNGARRPSPLDREPRDGSTAQGGSRRPIPLDREPPDGGTISSKVPSPPEAPQADRAQPPAPNGGRGNEGGGSPAVERGKEPGLETAPKSGDVGPNRRESYRYTPERSSPARRSVLYGRVETNSGDPREGVRVAAASRTEPRRFRHGLSDAFGSFAIGLEDGDWSVQVTMPSGRVFSVRQISVANGRVVDDQEQRDIPNLIISY